MNHLQVIENTALTIFSAISMVPLGARTSMISLGIDACFWMFTHVEVGILTFIYICKIKKEKKPTMKSIRENILDSSKYKFKYLGNQAPGMGSLGNPLGSCKDGPNPFSSYCRCCSPCMRYWSGRLHLLDMSPCPMPNQTP